jgi:hypothetical protein
LRNTAVRSPAGSDSAKGLGVAAGIAIKIGNKA